MTKQPMRADVGLDYVTFTCPCGQSRYTGDDNPEAFRQWILEHLPHTDGTCLEHTTERGQSVWATPQPDRVYDLKIFTEK